METPLTMSCCHGCVQPTWESIPARTGAVEKLGSWGRRGLLGGPEFWPWGAMGLPWDLSVCERVRKGVKGCVCFSLSLSVRLFFSWAIDCWINSWAMTLMTQISIQIIQGEASPPVAFLEDWKAWIGITGMSTFRRKSYIFTMSKQKIDRCNRFGSESYHWLVVYLPLWKIWVTWGYYSQSQYMEK